MQHAPQDGGTNADNGAIHEFHTYLACRIKADRNDTCAKTSAVKHLICYRWMVVNSSHYFRTSACPGLLCDLEVFERPVRKRFKNGSLDFCRSRPLHGAVRRVTFWGVNCLPRCGVHFVCPLILGKVVLV